MRDRSGNRAAWILGLLFTALVPPAANAQVLMKRHPDRTECPDTHLRLTARHPDGSPAAALRKQDLYLWFSMGTAEIRSMRSGEPASTPGKTGAPDTNILIVVRPQAAVNAGAVDAALRSLRAAASLHWKVAVLAPDGSITSFAAGADEAALRTALAHAIASVQTSDPARSIAEWTAAERKAFRLLQTRSGRHVIVELAQPTDEASKPTGGFAQDHTLDLLARDDMAQIYRLTASAGMPSGKEQYEASGGRAAPSIDALFHAIAADAPGSYELVIHPLFSCEPGVSYSLNIRSFQPGVQLFYPSTIRMAATASQ